ncbi:MAG TPA: TonB-dependent receptor [Flavobacteriaceae bacterium]|nr:TonB-dependent receptor [Flavobacteriaceae bacterium]
MHLRYSLAILLFLLTYNSQAQTSTLKGRVYNQINNEAIPFATVYIDSVQNGAITDKNGFYRFDNLKPGTYTIFASFLGFKNVVIFDVNVSSSKPKTIDIAMVEEIASLAEVEIKNNPFKKKEESLISVQTISAVEIFRNPGGNRDISKVIQILPGVGSTLSFRNDIIVRGGAPNENRFYLDGIEVPNINHFATQGSSGGPVGMINVNFIKEVDFYTGAFTANRGNALSSILEFEQINGNDEKLSGTIMIGSSDIGLTLDGPINKKSTFLFSARRSYLQFLFKALKLPFIPTYNDFQFKQFIKIDDRNQVTIIGLGAIDDFELNTSVNSKVSDSTTIKRNNYILGNLPSNKQWNYTVGAKWVHYANQSFQTFVISRNHLKNEWNKYKDNIELESNLLLDYASQEIENKFRFESTHRFNNWKWNWGTAYEFITYKNDTYRLKEINGAVGVKEFTSQIDFNKYAVFTQLSSSFVNNKLSFSFGIRTDFNDYSSDMNNPTKHLSPRFSASYSISDQLTVNFNTGRYYQLPPYTVLGYRNNLNELVNKINHVTYISSDHLVGGLEYLPTNYSKISIEGFYKKYSKYPFLLNDSISMANLGGDFGVIGNEAVISTSKGRSYGIELLMQQKLSTSIYGILSYTFVRSEFQDKNERYIPSSWDNRHLLNITLGKKLNKNWEIGSKFRLLGGAPYTPYHKELSAIKPIWDVTQQGIFDWNRLNEKRNPIFHSLDIRVDKKWYFKKWSLNTYLDIQNVYNNKVTAQAYLDVKKDVNGNPMSDLSKPNSYLLEEIENPAGTVLPSIGLMIEF